LHNARIGKEWGIENMSVENEIPWANCLIVDHEIEHSNMEREAGFLL
jgi:hypothetical protein